MSRATRKTRRTEELQVVPSGFDAAILVRRAFNESPKEIAQEPDALRVKGSSTAAGLARFLGLDEL